MGSIICGAGYLVKTPIRGAFNGLIIGALSIFLFLVAEIITISRILWKFTHNLFYSNCILGAVLVVGSGILGGYIYKLRNRGAKESR